ncbi:MAG: hypothetical protein H7Z41_08920 [Cytophagales bacterium]|nr:hypothetical protein [Armatimonadota bacterium]
MPVSDLADFARWFERFQQEANGIEILPVALHHVLAIENLPQHHKDPFDRVLIAQANAEEIGLLSAGTTFTHYTVSLLG